MRITALILGAILAAPFASFGQVQKDVRDKDMVFVKGGTYTPIYSIDTSVAVTDAFKIDIYPVTNAEYYNFLEKHPEWKPEKVKPIFAETGYLRHWPEQVNSIEDLEKIANQPVVNVSWFAAKKFCESEGKRLPNVDEWELAALASKDAAVGSDDPDFYQYILDWYSRPSGSSLGEVGSTFKNYYGIYDMHGLVWEWVLDFNTALITGESRGDNSLDKNLFCGGAAAGAADPNDYAAYMRYAFRASLDANYTIGNLGFRCAKDVNDEEAL